MPLSLFFLVAGFVLLILGADWLVKGAGSIARSFYVSDLVIGLTIVAFGTSAPETMISTMASYTGTGDIAIGNVLGSNIANIFLIIGVTALIQPVRAPSVTVWKEIPFTVMGGVVVLIMLNDRFIDGADRTGLSRSDAFVLLVFFAIFVYYVVNHAIVQMKEAKEDGEEKPASSISVPKAGLLILVGLGCLTLGGDWVVSGATEIALKLGVSQKFVALTIVAAGTSLPELATSAVAAYRKNADIALGNIVGSSIFNLFFVLGVAASVRPIPFDTALNPDVFVMIAAGLLLFLCMFAWGVRRTVQRHEGAIFLVIYVGYLGYVVYRG